MNILRMSVISGATLPVLAALALTVPASAVAGTGAAPLAITVAYEHLNLANQKEAAELYARLQGAARQVCATYAVSQTNRYAARKACYRQVMAKAVHDVKAREVTALHARAVRGGPESEQLASGGSATSSMSK